MSLLRKQTDFWLCITNFFGKNRKISKKSKNVDAFDFFHLLADFYIPTL